MAEEAAHPREPGDRVCISAGNRAGRHGTVAHRYTMRAKPGTVWVAIDGVPSLGLLPVTNLLSSAVPEPPAAAPDRRCEFPFNLGENPEFAQVATELDCPRPALVIIAVPSATVEDYIPKVVHQHFRACHEHWDWAAYLADVRAVSLLREPVEPETGSGAGSSA